MMVITPLFYSNSPYLLATLPVMGANRLQGRDKVRNDHINDNKYQGIFPYAV